MKKFFLILLLLLAGAAAAVFLWNFSGELLSMKDKTPPVIPAEVTLAPEKDFRLGELIEVSAEFTLPKCAKAVNPLVAPGEGTVLSQAPQARKLRSSWRYTTWQVSGTLCAMRPGKSKAGVMSFETVSRAKDVAKKEFTVAIPALDIKELPALEKAETELAGTLEVKSPLSKKYHFLWLLLLLLFPLWYLLRRKKETAVKVSLRKRTLGALESLRSEVVSRSLTAEQGIAKLSDVIRTYLEQRYKLPVSGKTTPEFLEEMEITSPLPDSDKPFLQNFLNSADMIKFAKAPCDAPAVSAAIDSAEKLVRNTALPEEEEKNV